MSRKTVIVGGLAGGSTFAARARRLDETAQIVLLERGPHISLANCGLPYHIGGDRVDNRIDVFALAIQAGMTVVDLDEAELAYAPQYGAAKDSVNLAGFIAGNVLRGDVQQVQAEELDEAVCAGWTLIDVREESEHIVDHLPGSLLLPLPQLRERRQEIPQDKPIAIYCATGQRSYHACRFLHQKGVECNNLAGGILVYRCVHAGDAGVPSVAGAACESACRRPSRLLAAPWITRVRCMHTAGKIVAFAGCSGYSNTTQIARPIEDPTFDKRE